MKRLIMVVLAVLFMVAAAGLAVASQSSDDPVKRIVILSGDQRRIKVVQEMYYNSFDHMEVTAGEVSTRHGDKVYLDGAGWQGWMQLTNKRLQLLESAMARGEKITIRSRHLCEEQIAKLSKAPGPQRYIANVRQQEKVVVQERETVVVERPVAYPQPVYVSPVGYYDYGRSRYRGYYGDCYGYGSGYYGSGGYYGGYYGRYNWDGAYYRSHSYRSYQQRHHPVYRHHPPYRSYHQPSHSRPPVRHHSGGGKPYPGGRY